MNNVPHDAADDTADSNADAASHTAATITEGALGDGALLWNWPGGISHETSRQVLAAYRALHADPQLRSAGLRDVVPSYCALALHFDPARGDADALRRRAGELLRTAVQDRAAAATAERSGRPGAGGAEGASRRAVRLPVVYDGEDLARVAEHAGLTPQRVIELHCSPCYTVAMIGFRPHFPYLIGMDERLTTPRLDTPRTRVAAGSVGIAGSQTGVYPVDSPGGWNLIGRTNPELLLPLRPGDGVRFEPAASVERPLKEKPQ